MQTYNKPPQVVSANPSPKAANVSTNISQLVLGFNTDLDVNFIDNTVVLQTEDRRQVPVSLQYKNRTLTVKLENTLKPGVTYTLTVFGDSQLNDNDSLSNVTGIRNIFGVPMHGNFTLTFTTYHQVAIPSPVISSPKDQAVLDHVPVLSWGQIDATQYEVQLSHSNEMVPVLWTELSDVAEKAIDIDVIDGLYYWRVRGKKGTTWTDWSPIYTFHVDTIKESPVVPEDTLAPDVGYDSFVQDDYVEFVDMFPKENFSNVGLNANIVFQVFGEITESDIEFEVFGEHVFGEGEDHGVLQGAFQCSYDAMTDITTIVFMPDGLQN